MLDFTITSFAVPVMTERVAAVVESIAKEDVQLVPVTISGQRGMVVLNVLRVISCVDEQRSEFVKWTENDHRRDLAGQYRQLPKLVLDAGTIPDNVHVFRVAGFLVQLLVSETVKIAIERVGCPGAQFIEIPS
jgi:hypothetical protein